MRILWEVQTGSNGWSHRNHSALAKWQLSSDCLIAVAYFSIPLELVYFIIKSQVFPFRWVIAQFGLFIVLCGITHLLTLWNYVAESYAAHLGMTCAKVTTAIVSCATAIVLVWVIPILLDVKKREEFYTQKSAELDVEVGIIKKDHQVSQHVRMLTDEIRSTLDRHTILNTTMVQLAHTLQLDSCNIWTPKAKGSVLEVAHRLGRQDDFAAKELPISHPIVKMDVFKKSWGGFEWWAQVFESGSATFIHSKNAFGATTECSPSCSSAGDSITPEKCGIVAVRIPMLSIGRFSHSEDSFALMAMAFSKDENRSWGDHELGIVEAVADQVAVALSHAAVVEESTKAQEQLIEQNIALQRAKREAEAAVIARSEFLVVMNHEMRTPMHAIIALSSVLMNTNLTEDQKSMVDTISKSGCLLSTLINDVLDLSKLESGSMSLDPHEFFLSKLLTDAEKLYSPLAQAKHLPISLTRNGDLALHVLGDSTRILQIILNVVGNSIKFTETGYVKVTVYLTKADEGVKVPGIDKAPTGKICTPKYLHVNVEDTGIGIKSTDIPRLFNKFVQADSSTCRKYGGTGLGLAISRKLVELMKGTITIESDGLNKGSTCRICVGLIVLEAKKCEVVVKTLSADDAYGADFTSMNIMAVDDNAVNRAVIQRLLKNLGCMSTVVDSGMKCLEVLEKEGAASFSVILLDICMPEMDGYEVSAELRKRYEKEERPLIVALTANADDKTRSKCLDEGMDGILTKPIHLNRLRSELNFLLQSKDRC